MEIEPPPNAMVTPSGQLPTVGPINESATSSASSSRTATHATAAYEIAGYETPMAGRIPSPRSIRPSLGVARARPFHAYVPHSVVGTRDETRAPSRKIILDLGYPATLDLKIFNQFDASRQIFSRSRDTADAPEFRIPWRFLRVLTGPHVQPSIMIFLFITTAPLHPLKHPSTTSSSRLRNHLPAAIEALAHFLDQPGGNDVVFCFPGRYADRYVLQRASPFFGTCGTGRSALADDSDVEMTRPRRMGRLLHEDGVQAVVQAGRGERVRGDITALAASGSTVITPMISVYGDDVQDNISLPLDTKGFMFQRTASPLMDDNIFVMKIDETSFNTFRAFLYYLYTGFISFSPQYPGTAKTQARNTLVGEYEEVPEPTRTSVAQVDLSGGEEAQALSRINTAIFNPLVATAELFSAFTRVHDSIKQTQLQVVIDNWNEVVKTEDWAIAMEKGNAQPDQYFASVLCEILEALPPRSA
ncbi:hypothetical protein FRC04_008518 [Tulasnella sp. 424]|nr:hypothetical protein FRC04_008518 [Tulasnella sp. 424]KAG8973995.1 hypothetical protein FRC05_008052 [Tulasnella sp. 425]